MLSGLFISVYLVWAHNNPTNIEGFKIWRGPSPDKMVVVATVPDRNAKEWRGEWVESSSTQFFGVSAYNALGDSAITNKDEGGRFVALGKPESPISLSFTVK